MSLGLRVLSIAGGSDDCRLWAAPDLGRKATFVDTELGPSWCLSFDFDTNP